MLLFKCFGGETALFTFRELRAWKAGGPVIIDDGNLGSAMTELQPTSVASAGLQYGKRSRLLWISRHSRMLILLAICISIAIPVYRNWQALQQRARWLYWSHRCATFQMPSSAKLIVTDWQEGKGLAQTPDYVLSGSSISPTAIYSPECWRRLYQIDPRCFWISDRWAPEPIAFMGSLRRPNGASRLVVVKGASTNAYELLQGVRVLVLPHPGLFEKFPEPVISPGWASSGRYKLAMLSPGVVDPNDPTHLSFKFDVADTQRGVIDAYLTNDDSLTFSLRDGSSSDVKLWLSKARGVPPTTREFSDMLRRRRATSAH